MKKSRQTQQTRQSTFNQSNYRNCQSHRGFTHDMFFFSACRSQGTRALSTTCSSLARGNLQLHDDASRVECPFMGAADNPSFISPERLKLKDPNLLSPYERLLLIINNKKNDDMEILEAIRLALPYCKETMTERNERVAREAAMQPRIDGPFDTSADIVKAQSRIMTLMALGTLLPHVGKTFIESLALMARTLEIAQGPGATTLRIIGGMPELQTEDNVTPLHKDRDEQASEQSSSRATG
jgi:hypothetical protein